MTLAGKTVVITGGSTGIGYELIKKLLALGAKNVAILDINDTNEASASLQELYPDGQTVIYLRTDVSDRENVWRSFGEVRTRFGTIDVVIGNAGILNELQPERMIQINLVGVVNSTQAAIEYMGKTNGGSGGIVMNIASVVGLDYMCVCPIYTASKHGVVGLTRTYADEIYKPLGITFVVVCPGLTDTPILEAVENRMRPDSKLEELAQANEVMGVQTPEILADCLAQILVNPSAATIYIVDAGKTQTVDIPNYWKKF